MLIIISEVTLEMDVELWACCIGIWPCKIDNINADNKGTGIYRPKSLISKLYWNGSVQAQLDQ
jgi:hypothetical protein